MRQTGRLFEIIQILRAARKPVTATMLADNLEVTERTIYRDMAALQAQRVPIAGEAGVGYILRPGYDLPPLMFTPDEIEALVLGAQLIRRTGDTGLERAAHTAVNKITEVLPDDLHQQINRTALFAPLFGEDGAPRIDLADIRKAIRDEQKLEIVYRDLHDIETRRTIWPLVVAYFSGSALTGAWCELRQDFRSFRTDRILGLTISSEVFDGRRGKLQKQYINMFNCPDTDMGTKSTR